MTQPSDVRFHFTVPEASDFEVVRFELTEGVSQPFRLELELSSFDPAINATALLDQEATFAIERNGRAERTVVGVVTAFEQDEIGFRRTRYRAVVESPLARLGLRHNSRIFQQVNTTEILATLLKEHRVLGARTAYSRPHEPREYCVQYRESDLAFFHRMRSINRALFIDADEVQGLGYEVGSAMFQGSSAS